MIHDGHMLYLIECLGRCDILIVALDDDELTKQRKKDPKRPFDPEQARANLLCYACLAHIITFRRAKEHPYDLIKLLRPDIIITSETTADVTDVHRKALGQYCGEVVTLPPQSTESTTAKFRRFAIQHGIETAEKMVTALNEIFGALGVRIVIENGGRDGMDG